MTTESTQPQPELGPSPANGPGQSQGHRRRRRRRKNKSTHPGAPQAQPQAQQSAAPAPVQAPTPQAQAAPPRPPAQVRPRQDRNQDRNQNGGQGQNQGRKKKFFQKSSSSASAAQPGNSLAGSTQSKRKGKQQRGPREFVGPMDHSYRIVNGNIADGPASTIQITNNGHHSYNPDVYQGAPTIPLREDAPTRIFCFIDDLFFMAKIQETARKLGVKVEFVKNDKEGVARLTAAPEAERPKLVVFDLNNVNAKPMTLIPKLKTKFKKATSIVGFLSHLQGDLKLKAVEAGCDTVMPRSAFSQSLPNLLRRYGMDDEEEYSPQPM
jgi:hypothetical protein